MNGKFFVPFETAKLLKEKRYPQDFESADLAFNKNGLPLSVIECDDDPTGNIIVRPTYHEVIDWLEGKGITIVLDCWFDCKKWSSLIKGRGKSIGISYQDTREEALNAAILQALEMI